MPDEIESLIGRKLHRSWLDRRARLGYYAAVSRWRGRSTGDSGEGANLFTAEEPKSPRLFSEITPALERRTRLGEEVRCYSSLTDGTLEVRDCRLFSEGGHLPLLEGQVRTALCKIEVLDSQISLNRLARRDFKASLTNTGTGLRFWSWCCLILAVQLTFSR